MSAKCFQIHNRADAAEILITGEIGGSYWDDSGTTEKEFLDALQAIPAGRKITVGINSEGGSVKDGLGIYNALRRRGADVTTRIDGYAVSIASVIALAGDRRVSPKSSIWMIHEPWSMAAGNADDFLKAAEMLETHGETIAAIYEERTGMKREDARAKMRAETWFRGDEALSMKFATDLSDEAVALNKLDPARYRNIPQDILQRTLLEAAPAARDAVCTKPSAASTLSPALEVGNGETEPTVNPSLTQGGTTMPEAQTAAAPNTAETFDAKAAVEALNEKVIALEIENKALRNQPVNQARVTGGEHTGQAAIRARKPGRDRFDFCRDEFSQLVASGVPVVPVYNANTMDTALTTQMLADGLIVVLQNRLPFLTAFTRDFGTDRIKPNAVVQVPIATAGGTAQTNATSFEDTTNFVGSIDNRAVTPARITVGAHITAAELNNGFRMAQFSEIKANEMADKIQALVNAVITTTNFDRTTELGAAALIAAATNFGADDLGTLWAAISKSYVKNIALHQDYYKKFIPANLEAFNPLSSGTMPGWNGFFLNTLWTGAEANTKCFACNPQAIVTASGLPLASPNRGMTTRAQTVTVPGIGLSVELQEWYSTSTKSDWANWEVIFGAGVGDGSAGVLVKSA